MKPTSLLVFTLLLCSCRAGSGVPATRSFEVLGSSGSALVWGQPPVRDVETTGSGRLQLR